MKKCISFFVVSGLLASGLFANSNEELRSSIDSLSSDIGLTPENLSPENISKLILSKINFSLYFLLIDFDTKIFLSIGIFSDTLLYLPK